jgi:hypothetical protein
MVPSKGHKNSPATDFKEKEINKLTKKEIE